jgi:mono/diheme cytochrome c family protein
MWLIPAASDARSPDIERGRYVTIIGGCNDCHTAGYASAAGKVPEKDWLMGDSLGWHGPWGTTYAINLRLYMAELSEQDWLTRAKHLETRPPMPWFTLQRMTESDLRAIYRFVRSLGPAGVPAPSYLPPDKTPPKPYIQVP